MKQFWSTTFLIGIFILLFSCSEENAVKKKGILYPNQDSELTLLMRDMYNYYDSLKMDIEKGEIPDNIRNFTEIHHAVATEPSKSSSPLYKAMSSVYLESADRLKDSNKDMPATFNNMIDNCMNCHQQMCPGPMVKIKKLYVKDLK